MKMNGNKVLASLSYFSIFFAPFLLPIIIYIIGERDVKNHAKKAFFSHIIPTIIIFGGVLLSGILGVGGFEHYTFGIIAACIIGGLVAIYYFIWNIVKGIQVLQS